MKFYTWAYAQQIICHIHSNNSSSPHRSHQQQFQSSSVRIVSTDNTFVISSRRSCSCLFNDTNYQLTGRWARKSNGIVVADNVIILHTHTHTLLNEMWWSISINAGGGNFICWVREYGLVFLKVHWRVLGGLENSYWKGNKLVLSCFRCRNSQRHLRGFKVEFTQLANNFD